MDKTRSGKTNPAVARFLENLRREREPDLSEQPLIGEYMSAFVDFHQKLAQDEATKYLTPEEQAALFEAKLKKLPQGMPFIREGDAGNAT